MKGVTLVVVVGADVGRTHTVPLGACCVLGRAGQDATMTAVVTSLDQRRLEREDQRRIAEHLRAHAAPGLAGARTEVAAFARSADLDLRDEAVSQTHAMVFCDEAGASLVDVASTNGTWVNGVRVTDSSLVPGDLLRIGESRLEVRGHAWPDGHPDGRAR